MVDAVLEIMQKAVVPWSNVVEKLVQQYLEMEGPKYVLLPNLNFFYAPETWLMLAINNVLDIFLRQELLKESYNLMEIRKLLRGYGIRNFNLSNSTQVMVRFLEYWTHDFCYASLWYIINIYLPQTLIRHILKQDLPSSLDDSVTLAEAYKLPTSQINYLYLIQLIGQGKVC